MTTDVRPLPGPRLRRADINLLLDTWERLYENEPHRVAPIRLERHDFLDARKNPYFAAATVQFFVAYQGGRPVGTISAQVDHNYQTVDPGTGFFGFFEFPDDPAVSAALLAAATAWLRERGMRRILGPLSFNTNHECGLLVDGFDRDPLVLTTWNPPHHAAHYAQLGLTGARDLLAYWLTPGPTPPRIAALAERVLRRHPEVRIRPLDPRDFAAETRRLFEIYNDAWQDNWGFVRVSEAEFFHMARGLKLLADPRYCYVAEVAGEPAAFSLTLPDLNEVIKPLRGRLFPFGLFRVLGVRKRARQLRVFALGIRRKHQALALGAPLYLRTWQAAQAAGVTGAEASWILDNNHRMRGALEKLGAQVYKTHRIYGAELPPTDSASRRR